MVADMAIATSNVSQINEMRREGEAAALIQAMLQELRNQIFTFNESAKDIFARWDESPRISAGAMALLKFQLDRSGITPDLFMDLGDKEYAASTHRSMRENVDKMLAVLPDEDKLEIDKMLEAAKYVTQSNYYLEHHDKVAEMREKKATIEKLKPRNGCSVQLAFLLGFLVLAWGIGAAIVSSAGRIDTGTTMLLLGGVLVGMIGVNIWQSSNTLREAERRFNELDDKFNIKKYESIEQQLGKMQMRVQKRHEDNQAIIQQFFGDSQLQIIAN